MRLRGKQLDAINDALKSGTAEDFNAALQKTCAQADGIGQFVAAPGSAPCHVCGKAVDGDDTTAVRRARTTMHRNCFDNSIYALSKPKAQNDQALRPEATK